MDVLIQDVRYALRSLRRSPGFTATVVAVMALGIGVNTNIFTVVNGILLRAMPFPAAERVVVVEQTNRATGDNDMEVSFPDLFDYRARARSFERFGAYYESNAYLTLNREPERFQSAVVSADLFPALGVKPMLGRGFTPEEEELGRNWSSVVVSHRIWRDRFASDPRVLGRTLRMNGRTRTIVGVMPPGFRFPETADFWIPLPYDPAEDHRDARFLEVVARLKPGAPLESARAELQTLAQALEREYPATNTGIGVAVVQIQERWAREIRPMMILLMAAVGFVLLIACANVANLMLARATVRHRELSLRLALSASRGRIARQLLTESVLLALAGGALGLLVAQWGMDLVLATIPIELPYFLHFEQDGRVLAFTGLVAVGTGILFGAAPALHPFGASLAESLKEGGAHASAGAARGRLRSALVVAEVALALVLLAGTGLMVRSFLRMQDPRMGLEPRGVLTGGITLPFAVYPQDEQKRVFFRELVHEVEALPGVRSAGAVTVLPAGNNSWTRSLTVEGGAATDPNTWPSFYYAAATPGYFRTVGIPLRRGREFRDADGGGAERVAIVSESAARRLWPDRDPIGRRLRFREARDSVVWRTVVGVVGDVRQLVRDHRRPLAAVYVPHAQDPHQTMSVVVRSDRDPAALAAAVRRRLQARDPDLPLYETRTLPAAIQRALWEPRLYTVLMGVFALLAVAIAAVGIHGVMAYSVAQRTQEIGIRMALGAAQGAVLRMVIGQAMRLTVLGLGIGLAAAFATTRLMANLLFGVSPSDPPTYLGVTLILAGSALLASWLPALRATRVDPMVALRCE